ncbi:hypothetical protein CAFE_11460 [Caprobacter fermentans]|uniref:Uncharacterized protein n=1 Tax=Caproicibacter fermentans TaxID=2576756 RepID=A0A6N8HYA9_9FIRM|nr:hypothetical protein [Caproicibacter fermentans]MVB10457.1 hypothetical protein [Caproicibacter fermentans]OCN00392.1 hypothetical protein A7X67_02055 [Clostridium sp. W14A]
MINRKSIEVAEVYPFGHRRFNCKIVALFAAFICFIPALTGCFNNNAEDPNWDKTHTTVTSPEEAIRQFGNDLLLDKIVLKNGYSKPYTEYILEHSGENSVTYKNRQAWRELSIQVNYGGKQFSTDEDNVALHIFFKENDRNLIGSEKYPNDGYENLLSGSKTTKEINGIKVTYHDFSTKTFINAFCAEFKYLGYTYFLETYSKSNKNLSWDTINQMLN